jgi:hypothetical protein
MLVGENLSSELARLSNVGGRIITDEVDRADQMVPGELDFKERRSRKLCQSDSPNLA